MRKPITLTGMSFVRFLRYWWIHTNPIFLISRWDTNVLLPSSSSSPMFLFRKECAAVTFVLIQKHVKRAAAATAFLLISFFFARSRSWLKHAMAFFSRSMSTEIVRYELMRDTYRHIVVCVCERIASASRKIHRPQKSGSNDNNNKNIIPLEHWIEKVFLKRVSFRLHTYVGARIWLWRCTTND